MDVFVGAVAPAARPPRPPRQRRLVHRHARDPERQQQPPRPPTDTAGNPPPARGRSPMWRTPSRRTRPRSSGRFRRRPARTTRRRCRSRARRPRHPRLRHAVHRDTARHRHRRRLRRRRDRAHGPTLARETTTSAPTPSTPRHRPRAPTSSLHARHDAARRARPVGDRADLALDRQHARHPRHRHRGEIKLSAPREHELRRLGGRDRHARAARGAAGLSRRPSSTAPR